MTAVLEPGQQLQWLSWWRHEATKLEQCNLASRINVTKGQLLGEGCYADLLEQTQSDDIIKQCCVALLRTWNIAEKHGWEWDITPLLR